MNYTRSVINYTKSYVKYEHLYYKQYADKIQHFSVKKYKKLKNFKIEKNSEKIYKNID